ncbi:hypothetical protein Mro03_58890 [Microbispora rosea subsp. rosea]|nr:hypothetical protein Mro03_58890 [Microbispora rosea subsp. rosea]
MVAAAGRPAPGLPGTPSARITPHRGECVVPRIVDCTAAASIGPVSANISSANPGSSRLPGVVVRVRADEGPLGVGFLSVPATPGTLRGGAQLRIASDHGDPSFPEPWGVLALTYRAVRDVGPAGVDYSDIGGAN